MKDNRHAQIVPPSPLTNTHTRVSVHYSPTISLCRTASQCIGRFSDRRRDRPRDTPVMVVAFTEKYRPNVEAISSGTGDNEEQKRRKKKNVPRLRNRIIIYINRSLDKTVRR